MKQTIEEVFAKWPQLAEMSSIQRRALTILLKNGWVFDCILSSARKGYKFIQPDGTVYPPEIYFREPALFNPLTVARELIEYDWDLSRKVDDVLFQWIKDQEASK